MKRLTAISFLCMLFGTAFVAGKSPVQTTTPEYPDSLRSAYLYTEGIKQITIAGDTLRAREFFGEALRNDSTYAPAYYQMASNGMYDTPDQAVELARKAWRIDSTNKWYHQFYGQTLLYAGRYDQALEVYRTLTAADPKDPDNYRLLAALYEQQQNPYMALATLDSAEIRFGRVPLLSMMKRRLLVATRQTDKAIVEARAMVDAAPYEAEHHVVLADLYGISGKDSLALTEYNRALQIDTTNVGTLVALADFHAERHNYTALLAITKRLFLSDAVPTETKVRRFDLFTSDIRFYREFYAQINDLASTLAIRYPKDKRVVELYGKHLIASGQLDQALELYKLHTHDTPAEESYFRWVIDIESYRQRPDSVNMYADRALKLFPEKVDFHIAKGNVLTIAKKFPEALRAYRSSLRYADSDSLRGAIWGLIGDTWHQKAEAEIPTDEAAQSKLYALKSSNASARKAIKASYDSYERSLSYNPDNALVLNNYAYFLALGGEQLEKALAMSSRVMALTANNPTYMDTHAWVLFRLDRAAEAKKIMQQAIALDAQSSPELMVHYGDILHALGEQFLAETYWRRALEKGYDAEQIARRIQQPKIPKE